MSKIENTRVLEQFIADRTRGSRPVPLKSTSFDVEIVSGLALVRQTRRFRNDEKKPIEAVMTFPVPFDAVVTRLEAEVDGRRLKGVAVPKVAARKSYEDAVDGGKAAVLHEELLRGLHMVSVANVAPLAEIVVVATYVVPISITGDVAHFRIPQTIGDVYGQLPLEDSDQIAMGGQNGDVEVAIRSESGKVYVNNGLPVDGRVGLRLNDQINVRVEGLELRPLFGTSADGRSVLLDFEESEDSDDADLDVEVMADVSGSMGEPVSRDLDRSPENSKWNALCNGLAAAGRCLRASDKVNFWTFGDDCRKIGSGRGDQIADLADKVTHIGGGTRLVEALDKVAGSRSETNILLITDGKSATGKAVDIQKVLATGARVTVVLIGDDALEVRVGQLAAQSGGQMFVVRGLDTPAAVEAAIASMRGVPQPPARLSTPLDEVTRTQSGLRTTPSWYVRQELDVLYLTGEEPAQVPDFEFAGAYGAYLALSGLDEAQGAALAAAEGIVSHLTSIVLVDEAGEAVEGLPEQRKVALPDWQDRGLVYGLAGSAAPQSKGILRAASSGGGAMMATLQTASMSSMDWMDESQERGICGGYSAGPQASFFRSPERDRVGGFRPARDGLAEAGGVGVSLEWVEESVLVGGRPGYGYQPGELGFGDTDAAVKAIEKQADDAAKATARDKAKAPAPPLKGSLRGIDAVFARFDWNASLASLTSLPLGPLPASASATIVRVAALSEFVKAAAATGVSAMALAVGILATEFGSRDRTAARIARNRLGAVEAATVAALVAAVRACM